MNSSYLAVGYTCNHKCICCPLTTYNTLHKPLSLEDIKIIVSKPEFQTEPKHVIISGGEPMLHPDFFNILDHLFKNEFAITIFTNASQCAKKDFVAKIKSIVPNDRIDIVTAIHSNLPQIHDKITGVNGSLFETLEGLDNLIDVGIPITIKNILSKLTIKTLSQTFMYLDEHFRTNTSFQFCSMDYSGKANKNIEELFVTMEEIQPYLEETLDFLEVKQRKFSIIETPLCSTDPYYWKYFEIQKGNLDAYIAPTESNQFLNTKFESQCGAYYKECDQCSVQKWCPGTWVTAYQYQQKGLLSPICINLEG